jgi:hypothetical protein
MKPRSNKHTGHFVSPYPSDLSYHSETLWNGVVQNIVLHHSLPHSSLILTISLSGLLTNSNSFIKQCRLPFVLGVLTPDQTNKQTYRSFFSFCFSLSDFVERGGPEDCPPPLTAAFITNLTNLTSKDHEQVDSCLNKFELD